MANPFHAPYEVSQVFGCTGFPSEPAYNGCEHFHLGLDLVGPSDTCPVYAIMPGTVFAAGTDTDGANYVIIQSPNYFVAFWHLSAITCQRGQQVDTTTQIGNQGTSGRSTGYHLHLQLMHADHYGHGLNSTGIPVDPTPFLNDNQGATPTDMNPLKIAKDLYEVLDPSYNPPDTVIQDKAQSIASTGSLIPVLHDLLDAKPWRSPESYNLAALEAYAVAKGFADPHDYALERVQGGDTLEKVLAADLTADKQAADHTAMLYHAAAAQLDTFAQSIHDLQNRVAALDEENRQLQQGAQPTAESAITHDADRNTPDETPADPPVTARPPMQQSYLAGLYYLLAKLFLGR